MSCTRLSLLTKVTRLPRVTVTLCGPTALFAMVIVAPEPVPPDGVGDVALALVDPPPQAARENVRAVATLPMRRLFIEPARLQAAEWGEPRASAPESDGRPEATEVECGRPR